MPLVKAAGMSGGMLSFWGILTDMSGKGFDANISLRSVRQPQRCTDNASQPLLCSARIYETTASRSSRISKWETTHAGSTYFHEIFYSDLHCCFGTSLHHSTIRGLDLLPHYQRKQMCVLQSWVWIGFMKHIHILPCSALVYACCLRLQVSYLDLNVTLTQNWQDHATHSHSNAVTYLRMALVLS